MMASNYFGPFILARLLVPVLQSSSPNPRIVNVASFTHHCGMSKSRLLEICRDVCSVFLLHEFIETDLNCSGNVSD